MGRIGRNYPRFEQKPLEPAQELGDRSFHALGAAIGIAAALALIGWVLTR